MGKIISYPLSGNNFMTQNCHIFSISVVQMCMCWSFLGTCEYNISLLEGFNKLI